MYTILRGIFLGLSITAPIGPTNIEIIRRGTREGWRAAASFSLGVMVALVLYLVLVTAGLSFITESATFTTLLTISGIFILAFLAYQSFKDFFTGTDLELDGSSHGDRHFVPGILLTIANPAILLLWTGIMGADLATSHASAEQGMLLSAGSLVGVAVFFTGLTFVVHHGRKFLRQQYFRYVSLVAGIVLLYFSLKFIWILSSQLI